MASRYDLNNDETKFLTDVEDEIRARRGYCSPFDEGVLARMIRKHGGMKTAFVIHHSMANDWLKSSRWELLMELVERYGTDRVLFAIRGVGLRENHSLDMVEKICKQPQLATREMKSAGAPPIRTAERPWPPKDWRFTQYEAGRWLTENGHEIGQVLEFFDNGGRDERGNQLYLLKGEYR